MREETFWYKKPRYSEVRVMTRRVIARSDCIVFYLKTSEEKDIPITLKRLYLGIGTDRINFCHRTGPNFKTAIQPLDRIPG
jgi:hypothetical protein